VRCTVDQVLIVSGAQEALDLLGRTLLDPGDRVCMEDPGYIGASLVFKALGARLTAMPVDAEGMQVPNRSLRGVRLAYVTPAHQFPLGVTMTLPRRFQLLEWARSTGAIVIEDDYDSEYRYRGGPIPALQGLDDHGVVAFFGSFNKVLFPSLRLGYVVLPNDLIDIVAGAKSIVSRHAPVLEQAILCDFMDGGHFGRHLRRMRQIYAERRQVLLEESTRYLGGLLEIADFEAGLQTAGFLQSGITSAAAVAAASARQIDVIALGQYSLKHACREGLQLGFAALDAREIRRGVCELATALASVERRHTT
jgi:GntR family transcriptional regulator/MocR family aminotransferase